MILFLCDNERVYNLIKPAADMLGLSTDFRSMPGGKTSHLFPPIDLKNSPDEALVYDLLFSAHANQVVPKYVTDRLLCVNMHPGLNPINRGVYPHVFSIAHDLPAGVTLHVMDEWIDHGPIIAQLPITIDPWDTSYEVLEKIYQAELEIFNENILKIVSGNFVTRPMPGEGNLNRKKDFAALCKLDLGHTDTLENHLRLLRGLTHRGYRNAYFLDTEGNKTYVSVELRKDHDDAGTD